MLQKILPILSILGFLFLSTAHGADNKCEKFDTMFNEFKEGSKKISKDRDESGDSCERFVEMKNNETGESCFKQRQFEEVDFEPFCERSKIVAEYCSCGITGKPALPQQEANTLSPEKQKTY